MMTLRLWASLGKEFQSYGAATEKTLSGSSVTYLVGSRDDPLWTIVKLCRNLFAEMVLQIISDYLLRHSVEDFI